MTPNTLSLNSALTCVISSVPPSSTTDRKGRNTYTAAMKIDEPGFYAFSARISGQADTMFTSVIASEAHIASGRLKVMGVAGAKRHAAIPQVATFEEQGIRGANVYTWFGMVTTAKTHAAIIDTLNAALNRALAQGEIRQRLEHLGLEVAGGTPARFGTFMQDEADNLTRLIKRGALKVEP